MNSKFNLERSTFIMMSFVAVIGLFFVLVRSDFVIQYRHYNNLTEKEPLVRSKEPLAAAYKQPAYLVLTGDDAKELADQTAFVLNHMGKRVERLPLKELDSVTKEYDGMIIATENLDALTDPSSLLRYAENGGSVFFATRPSPGNNLSTLYQRIGMIETGSFVETKGLKLTKPIFRSAGNRTFATEQIVNSSLNVRLAPEADLQVSSPSGIPLLWKTEYGVGQFVVFNGSMLALPHGQSILIKGLQMMTPELIYPVLNAAPTILKGFPFPIPDQRHPNEKSTMNDYYRYTFWPEMQRIEAKYDLNYTAAYVAAFHEKNTDFSLSQEQENMILYSRELLRMGGEMGLQGYNHLPIGDMNKLDIRWQYQELLERTTHALPGYQIRSFIPIDQQDPLAHLALIRSYFPDLHAVLAPIQYSFSVEWPKTEPLPTAILNETFTGFTTDEYSNWLVYNSLLSSGYFSQSLQPQEFLSGKKAEVSLKELEQFSAQLAQDVPWLRRTVLSEAARSAIHTSDIIVYEEKTDQGVTFHLNKVSSPSYFFFSTDKKMKSTKHCHVKKIGHDLYLVETDQLTFSIGLEG
ncbi:hypothetical protein JOC78_002042 [Bacillus ectoiniformans]|uniref:DUF2194 domain-containing protein n=1 Tax=Bacillus ectoiniformans TaxID=1494429 RepID=UPI001957159A|nr:DUF2194 domain-containing protein [Bacillus ectoiniformans]MBM7649089.1 hypothetical protein [Bacillus ectoiniformans]